MKKKDKKFIGEIKESFDNLNDITVIPEILNKENIASIVENQEQNRKTSMSGKQKKTTTIASIAAVIVLCACVLFAYRAAKNPSSVVPVPPSVQKNADTQFGNAPLFSAYEYATIEDRFTSIARKLSREPVVDYYESDSAVIGEKSETATESNSPVATDGATEKSFDYSKTNIQVEGVDEADIVKTDGKFLYVVTEDYKEYKSSSGDKLVSNGVIKIVDIRNNAEPKVVSSFIPKAYDTTLDIKEIYVEGNNLIVIASEFPAYGEQYEYNSYFEGIKVLVSVYDISDRGEPKEKSRYEQSGFYISSRLIDNRVYLFTNYKVEMYADLDVIKNACIPMCGENGEFERVPANDICIMRSNEEATEYLVVGSVNFRGNEPSHTVKAVLGGGENCYCSGDMLYVSNSVYDYALYSEADLTATDMNIDMGRTEIFAFLLNEGKIEYKCYGTVSGIINDQFSMDEYNGYFRIATTVGWNGYSIVSVLDKDLKRVGELTKIAEGESIYAVRFLGDTGYVVTYENTDPLHVLDLSDPKNPKAVGELKVPGFSNYLHPYSQKYLIGIGEDRDENGELPDGEMNTKISVFDVSDPKNPVEVSKYVLSGTSSAQYNHKAFTVLNDSTFIIPVSDWTNGTEQSVRFAVSEEGELTVVASYVSDKARIVYQDLTYDKDGSTVEYDNEIVRTVYASEAVFNIGELYVEAYSPDSGEKLSEVMILDGRRLFERDVDVTAIKTYNGPIEVIAGEEMTGPAEETTEAFSGEESN